MFECVHCHVEGLVQGVCFRDSTRRQARTLGLRGWVRNLPDGRVELQACGDPQALRKLRAWLSQGPPQARVARLDCRPATAEPVYEDFEIRFS